MPLFYLGPVYAPMTPDEARAKLNALYQDFGVPESVPLFGNIWNRATNSLVTAIQKQGTAKMQQAFADALQAGEVLAAVTPAPSPAPDPTPDPNR
jgi:hypothetical protein